MRGFVEHNGKDCLMGEHSNRVPVKQMCPVFLELRRTRLRETMRRRRFEDRIGLSR